MVKGLVVFGMRYIRRAQTVFCKEAVLIEQICKAVILTRCWNPIDPRNIADLLTHILPLTIVGNDTEHTDVLIPKGFIDLTGKRITDRAVNHSFVFYTDSVGNPCKCIAVSGHVGVDRRTDPVAGDGKLHAVVAASLTVHTAFRLMVIPRRINFLELRKKCLCRGIIARDIGQRQKAVCNRKAVQARIARRAPELCVFLQKECFLHPATIAEMMARRTADRIVFAAPRDIRQKFCNDVTVGHFLDVPLIDFTAVVIGNVELLIGGCKFREMNLQHWFRLLLFGQTVFTLYHNLFAGSIGKNRLSMAVDNFRIVTSSMFIGMADPNLV